MMNKLIVSFLLFILASCNDASRHAFAVKYMNIEKATASFQKELADATPEFRRGWENGCEVGMSNASSNTFYQMFYRSNMVDGYAKANSADYRTGWGYAFWYCARYEYIKQKSSIWGSSFSGYR